jgi:hypothetical protein
MGAQYDSGLYDDDPPLQPRKEPEVGSIVTYKLPLSARPADPHKLWRGKVLACYTGGVLVEVTEVGYEKMCEYVQTANIVNVE